MGPSSPANRSTPAPYTVTSTLYIDGIFEKTNGGAVTKYYGAFGRNLAVRSVPTGTGPGTLSYLLADHLGSTVGALDAAGNSLGTQSYWPFGAARSQTGGVATDKLYTSQQRESLTSAQTPLQGATDALGTYFYHARFYSTALGRFASADTLAVDGLNRYSYVGNNPVNYTDPSGLCFVGPDGEFLETCTPDDAQTWFECAFGDACNARPDIQEFARQGVSQRFFWQSVYTIYSEGGLDVVGNLLTIFVASLAVHPDNWNKLTEYAWQFFSDVAHVSESFFKASLYALVSGNFYYLHALSDPSRMFSLWGAKNWWDMPLYLGISGQRHFRESFSRAHMSAVEAVAAKLTVDLARRLGDTERHKYPFSLVQLGWLSGAGIHAAYSDPEYDPWSFDLRCHYGGSCVGIAPGDVPWPDWIS